ncbi:kinase-like domain-containing protein [Mycena olivaceomarginata]|nr:kinase-like domain-containing protein [Mycena olivaceomarginata]
MTCDFLDLYDTLQVIGHGAFGIVRKVRRKSDGVIFARKELNFGRTTEGDRKQIAAEVNILKTYTTTILCAILRNTSTARPAFCISLWNTAEGGDLSTTIKRAVNQNRPIPEDTIWAYFMQILLALDLCHTAGGLFLDEANSVKLGDFGLSKALVQGFSNTYVGTPHYMSPELMHGTTYNSKTDIWSLGCLLYELCALKPPFHNAGTEDQLRSLPAMWPSAAQLLQHERIKFAFKVSEMEKLLNTIKSRELTLKERESRIIETIQDKTAQINLLQSQLHECQSQLHHALLEIQSHPAAIQAAVHNREAELRVLVLSREEEFERAMQRKEEIMNFLQRREAEVNDAWRKREGEMRAILWREFEARERIFQDRDAVLQQQEIAVADGEKRIAAAKELFDERAKKMGKNSTGMRLFNDRALIHQAPPQVALVPKASARRSTHSHPTAQFSPMRSVMLTATGEALATPSPADLAVTFDLRKSEDEADDKDQDLGEKTKSKSQRSGTGDFTEVKSDAREGQRCLRPAAHKNGRRESQVDDENAHDGAAMRQGAARRSSRVTKNRLGNGTVDFIADNLEGQECQRIRRADQPKADTKRTAGIKAMNEFMPIFNISKFSNPRELKKILKGDLELQYEWHHLRELRSDKGTQISPLADLSKKQSTKAELANVIVAALKRCSFQVVDIE